MALRGERLEWTGLAAGQVLKMQGEPGDAMDLSISGRLRAHVGADDGSEHRLRETSRGEIIGQMSPFTDEPRSATGVVIRGGVLVRLDKAELLALPARSANPGASPPAPHDGERLCNRGTLGSFPVDLLRKRHGIDRLIGVELGMRKPRRLGHDEVPGTWALLRPRLCPCKQGRYERPSLMAYLVDVTLLYRRSPQRSAKPSTELFFDPRPECAGLAQGEGCDCTVRQDREHAMALLQEQCDAGLAAWRAPAA